MQPVPVLQKDPGRAQSDGHVGVMPAGVHFPRRHRGEGQPRGLVHGKRVHVRPQAHSFPGKCSLDQPHHRVLAGIGGVGDAQLLQHIFQVPLRIRLLPAQFRVHVQFPPRRDDPGSNLLRPFQNILIAHIRSLRPPEVHPLP
ncbi:hypothetical protein SDC9_181570 [bioreactor metagenome]|uniref:Uncharacterized protein n=1 Tax=bioreactor metagenome TaxID=1076179 RepID=A0A645H510_9ZZZZ